MGNSYGGDHWGETTGQGDGMPDAYDLNCLVRGTTKDGTQMFEPNPQGRLFQITEKMATGNAGGLFGEED